MKLQITTDYAVRILLYLQENRRELHTAMAIAEAVGITYPFFIKIATLLKKHSLVNVVQGRNGGYALGKPAHKISLYDVFRSIEGELRINRCLASGKRCTHGETTNCGVYSFLWNLQDGLIIQMSEKKLSDLGRSGEDNVERAATDIDLQRLQSRFNAIA